MTPCENHEVQGSFAMNQAASDKVFLSLTDVKDQLGVGRSTIYREIAAGRLRTCKLGSRTLIHKTDFDDYCASLANTGGGSHYSASF